MEESYAYKRHKETAHYPEDRMLGVPHPACRECQWYELVQLGRLERVEWD